MNNVYKLIYGAGQGLRTRNYKLFRRIVENPLVRVVMQSLFGKKLLKVETPEGSSLTINPVYHGNFLTRESILSYEPDMRKLFASTAKENMVVYDVGANVGVFSLLFLNLVGPNGFVYAFEPEASNVRCLLDTKNSNTFDNFEVQAVGVGEKSETLFFDRRGGAMSGHLVDQGSGDNQNMTEVQVYSIDEFIFDQGKLPPSLLKIDVEGNELKVVNGMARTLKEHRPIIICELHPALESSVLDICDILDGYGYKSYDVTNWVYGEEKEALDSYKGVHHIIAIAQ